MFGSSKKSEEIAKNTTGVAVTGALNALVKGTLVEGVLRCDHDLRVDGTVKGKLSCRAKVIIGPTGVVEGEIRCLNAVIEGRFNGTLSVCELLHVRETAEVEGNITTHKLVIQAGARFNVSCKMDAAAANTTVKHFEGKPSNDATTTTEKSATTVTGKPAATAAEPTPSKPEKDSGTKQEVQP
jgi:cytoskeletal protein CcmA (bactofilin family)